MTNMITDQEFDDVFKYVQDRSDVRITNNARSLIVLSVRSIYEDPHETWRIGRWPIERLPYERTFETISDDLARQLPEYMLELSQRCRARGRSEVSYFDALHWIAEHLEPICKNLRLGADK
jgi:hypothetical protein